MASNGGIVDFSSRDGLDPAIMRKLNHNFQQLVGLIASPQVTAVAQATEPSPRTDETLWYDTETGDLYIWAQEVDLQTGEPTGEWSWRTLDLNLAVISDQSPLSSGAAYEPSEGQFLWFDTTTHKLWVYYGPAIWDDEPSWVTLEELASLTFFHFFLDPDGSMHSAFVQAVQAAINE